MKHRVCFHQRRKVEPARIGLITCDTVKKRCFLYDKAIGWLLGEYVLSVKPELIAYLE
jgi:hypothetical protein